MKVTCRICKQEKEVNVTKEQYQALAKGALIQNAMPNVPSDERELLISGMCGKCFDNLFPQMRI